MSQGERIEVIPIYQKGKLQGKSVFLELPAGRVELSKAWWRSCPNSCCAHLPGIFSTCEEFCQPLRKSVGALSREFLAVEHCTTTSCRTSGSSFRKHRLVVSPQCRHKDVVQLKHIQRHCGLQENNTGTKKSTDDAYDLRIGPSGHRPWMRFRIQWASQTLKENGPLSECISAEQKSRNSESDDGWLQAETALKQSRRRTAWSWGQKIEQHSSGSDSKTRQLLSNGFLSDKNETSNSFIKASSKRKLFVDGCWSKVGGNQDNFDRGYYDYSRLHRVLPLGQPSGSSGDEEGDDDDGDDNNDDTLFELSSPQRTKEPTAQRQLLFSAHNDSAEASEHHLFRGNDFMREAVNSSPDSPLNESMVIPISRKVTPQAKQLLTADEVCAEPCGVVDRKDNFGQKGQKRHRFARTLLSKEETAPTNESRFQRNDFSTRQAAIETTNEGDCVHNGNEEECCNNDREPDNNTQQPCLSYLSYLSLPAQDSESYCSQDELTSRLSTAAESRQMWGARRNDAANRNSSCVASQGPLPPSVQRACDLQNAEWRALQRNGFLRDATSTGSFRCSLIAMIVFRNQEGDHFARPSWLPTLLDDETLVHRNTGNR